MSYQIGDKVYIKSKHRSGGNDYVLGELATIIGNNGYRYRVRIHNYPELDYFFYDEELVLVDKFYPEPNMKKAINIGDLVEVNSSRPEIFQNMEDLAKELGSTEKFDPNYKPREKEEGNVIGEKDGYVLVDFSGKEVLIDVTNLNWKIRKEAIKFLLKYPNNSLEEFQSEDECKKRVEELHQNGSLKAGDTLKLYKVDGFKEVSLKINVFLS